MLHERKIMHSIFYICEFDFWGNEKHKFNSSKAQFCTCLMHLNALHMYNIELLKSPKSELIYETCTVQNNEVTSFSKA